MPAEEHLQLLLIRDGERTYPSPHSQEEGSLDLTLTLQDSKSRLWD